MQRLSFIDRFLMLLTAARSLRGRAEDIQKHRRFKRFWTKIEPTLRTELDPEEPQLSIDRDERAA